MASPTRRSRRLQYENLESREMMAVTATLKAGTLTVKGTKKADNIAFRQYNGVISIAGVKGSWAANSVNAIAVDGKNGNDVISFNSLANGGNQALAEYIVTRPNIGTDLIHLADGHDLTLTGSSHVVTISASGTEWLDGVALTWNNSNSNNSNNNNNSNNSNQNNSNSNTSNNTTTNWFDSHVIDSALRSLGHNLFADGRIDRNDMISLLRNAEDGSVVDATEFTDLKSIVGNASLFGTLDYVDLLASNVVNGNAANAKYQGAAMGNLAANSSSAQMEKLIDKWFLGLDHPTAGGSYRQVSGTLFVGGPTYGDIKQGYLGDCYFMSSLAETALKNPSVINNMFIVDGDGTYTVRFYNNGQARYVTVDSMLPTDGSGRLLYADLGAMYNNSGNELWTALAEKAYAQINEMGWLRSGLPGNGQNSYSAIEGGYIYAALGQITGQATTPFTSTAGTASFTAFVYAYNAGKEIGFASKSAPASSSVVGNHAYAVLSYNASNQTITLFNPWGTAYGLVTMTWSQIQGSFSYFDHTA